MPIRQPPHSAGHGYRPYLTVHVYPYADTSRDTHGDTAALPHLPGDDHQDQGAWQVPGDGKAVAAEIALMIELPGRLSDYQAMNVTVARATAEEGRGGHLGAPVTSEQAASCSVAFGGGC